MRNTPLILFGGISEERLVSVASAQNLSSQLPEALLWFISPRGDLHEVSRAELAQHANAFTTPFLPRSAPFAGKLEGTLELLKGKTVLMALHGTEGEDGTIQALFERHRIPFTGSGSKASREAFDKKRTKELAKDLHLSVAIDLLLTDPQSARDQAKLREFYQQHPQLVLKPVANGSSVGLFIVKSQAQFNEACSKLKSSANGAYLVEPFLEGREITVGVAQQKDGSIRALPCSEVRVIETGRQFDYEGKYLGHGVQELTPAPLTPEQTQACQALAMSAHRMVGGEGYTRTDMILTARGPVLLEINTLPGLSRASFIPQQLSAQNEGLRSFFLLQGELAERRAEHN